MNNDEYFTALNPKLKELKHIRRTSNELAKCMIGNSLYEEDLFFASVLNRSLSLLDGFVDMLENRNLACAGILLRSQPDNCMRLYAAFIAQDKRAFIRGFLEGKRISDFKDDRGVKMRDSVLRKRLETYDSRICEVYERTSGYVHLSGVAFHLGYQSIDDHNFGFSIGVPLKEEANKYLLEAAGAFIHYMKLLFFLLDAVVKSKERAENGEQPMHPTP